MHMWKCLSVRIALFVGSVLIAAAPATATTIQFTNWSLSGSETVIPLFTVSDDPLGAFQITIGIDPISPNQAAEISGIYFDLGDDDIAEADIFNESPAHTDIAFNASKINGVTALNLGDFEVVLGYKPRIEAPVSFQVSDKMGGLMLTDWTRVGIRWQAVGATTLGNGSDREVSTTAVPLPEPTTVVLLGLGLIGLGFTRRYRQGSS